MLVNMVPGVTCLLPLLEGLIGFVRSSVGQYWYNQLKILLYCELQSHKSYT